MEKVLRSFLLNEFEYSLTNLSLCVDYDDKSNIINFFQKKIFKEDVLNELKILLPQLSSEKFTVSNEVIRKTVTELLNLKSSDVEGKIKINVFYCIFEAFALNCKEEESLIVLQFFSFLCHILGINDLLENDINESVENLPSVNKSAFKIAFKVDISKCCSISLLILKGLLIFLSKKSFKIDSVEFQAYHKWFNQLIKTLSKSSKYQSICMEIFSVCIDIDLKLIENNLNEILTNVFTQNKCLDENFHKAYAQFLEKTLNTFAKYQRILKFITRFLLFIKDCSKTFTLEDIFPLNISLEFSRCLTLLSGQQLLTLVKTLIEEIQETCNKISQTKNGSLAFVFMVTSHFLTSSLKNVRIYAPTTSNLTLQDFVNELNHLNKILQDFGNFILTKRKFILKNETILQNYLELYFFFFEVQALIYCYESSAQSVILETDNFQSDFNSKHWNSLVKWYCIENLENCHYLFFQIALQRIRILKLKNINSELCSSDLDMILAQFNLSVKKFNLLHNLSSEDMILLMEILPINHSKTIITKFLAQILEYKDEKAVLKWLSNNRLLESQIFNINLFAALLREINLSLKKVIAQKGTKNIGLLDEYFDENNNIDPEKILMLPNTINSILIKSKKFSKKFHNNSKEKNDLYIILEVFKVLPLMNMSKDFNKLGLAFAVELAVLCSRNETLALISLEKLFDFFSYDIDLNACFNTGLLIKWLSELSFESNQANKFKVKIIERLVNICSKTQNGISEIELMIESHQLYEESTTAKALETQVIIYDELGKCSQRGKKRKSESNTIIENCRTKLAKIITEEVKLDNISLNEENYKLLFKMLRIELHQATKDTSESFTAKFQAYFHYAVDKLKNGFDEACFLLLIAILEAVPQIRVITSDKIVYEIWSVLKNFESVSWCLFVINGNDNEYENIINDLLRTTKESLNFASCCSKESPNYFAIWESFLESNLTERRNKCQAQLQKLFHYIQDCHVLLSKISVERKVWLIKFFCYCLSSKKLVLTTQMLDTVVDVIILCSDDPSVPIKDFHDLFTKQAEAATKILVKHSIWTKSKIHLNFSIFKQMLEDLSRRSNAKCKPSNEDILYLSACAFSLEKWINLTTKMKKDFARTAPYFITEIISCITAVTVLPAIKIHLVNCLNSLLSMTDSHSISYLLRVLKPGHQQVFTSMYNQFKKFYKYTGKV